MKKLFNIFVIAAVAFSAQSCLHDDEEVFDTPAAERIAESASETEALLKSSPNGWRLNYYLGEDYSSGATAMFMRFDDAKVYVSCDAFPVDSVSSSTWSIKQDQGVVISVDTYNEILHTFSDPSSSALDGMEGDYEFIVQRATQDSIFVKGKKWKNKMVLTRVSEDTNWADYLTEVNKSYDALAIYYMTDKGTQLAFNWNSRLAYVGDDTSTGHTFCATPGGIVFAQPVEIDGKQVSNMTIDTNTRALTCNELGTIDAYAKPLTEMLLDGLWFVTPDGMSNTVTRYFKYLVEGMADRSFDLGFASLGQYYGTKWSFNIGLVRSGYLYIAYVEYDTEVIDDNTLKISNGTYDDIGNAQFTYESMKGSYVMDMFGIGTKTKSTTWKLSTDDPLRPTYIEFENAAKSSQVFRVLSETVYYPFGTEE